MKEKLAKIRITFETKNKIAGMAKKKGLKEITILEYLLSGKIPLEEL